MEKHFLTEIYRNIQTFAFKVLQKCSPWASSDGAVLDSKQMFTSSQKYFWLYCESKLFSMSRESRFVKWVRFFKWNCIVKWLIFFARFCWLWDFLLETLKMPAGTFEQIIKKLCVQNNIFEKRIPNIKCHIWNYFFENIILDTQLFYTLDQISFLETALGHFSQCVFIFPCFLLAFEHKSTFSNIKNDNDI